MPVTGSRYGSTKSDSFITYARVTNCNSGEQFINFNLSACVLFEILTESWRGRQALHLGAVNGVPDSALALGQGEDLLFVGLRYR